MDSVVGNTQDFRSTDNTLEIDLDRTYQYGESADFTIYYRGIPPSIGNIKGLQYRTHGNNEPVIASLSTPFLSHTWWPCKDGPGDKPDSVYVDITIPDTSVHGLPLLAVSNGILENVSNHQNKKTFRWRHRYPIIPYYVMVAISNYQTLQDVYRGDSGEYFPIDYYVFYEHMAEAQAGIQDFPEVMRFYSALFGPYPFQTEKYGMTQLGFYGGIENQTNTIINSLSINWFYVFVHELAHMWFGDMITCIDWHHGWLNEGFATYAEALWVEYIGGFNAYQEKIRTHEYFEGGTLYLQDTSDPFQVFIPIIYDKGAYTLHMLRHVVGDSLFFQSLYRYAQHPDYRYAHASTEDFQSICEDVCGIDLDFFFQQWIYDAYYPIYECHYSQNIRTGNVTATISQVQSEYGRRPVFEMPVDLAFEYAGGGDTLVTIWNDQQVQDFVFQFDRPVLSMSLDPDRWILREIQQEEISHIDVQNYPNPFNRWTIIHFHLPESSEVTLKIFNLMGEEVRTLVSADRLETGRHQKAWDGLDNDRKPAASGVYLYHIQIDGIRLTHKMILLR